MSSRHSGTSETLVGPDNCRDARLFQQVADETRRMLPSTRVRDGNGEKVPTSYVFGAVRRITESLRPTASRKFELESASEQYYTVFDENAPGAQQALYIVTYGADILERLGNPEDTAGQSAQRQLNSGSHYSALKPETSIYFSKALSQQQVKNMQTLPWPEVESMVNAIACGKDGRGSLSV
jgi:hypothetical protein